MFEPIVEKCSQMKNLTDKHEIQCFFIKRWPLHAMSQQFIYSVLKNETRIPRQDQLFTVMGAAAKWTKFPTKMIRLRIWSTKINFGTTFLNHSLAEIWDKLFWKWCLLDENLARDFLGLDFLQRDLLTNFFRWNFLPHQISFFKRDDHFMQCLNDSSTKNETRIPRQDQLFTVIGAAAKWTKFPTKMIRLIIWSTKMNFLLPRFWTRFFGNVIFWKRILAREFFGWEFFNEIIWQFLFYFAKILPKFVFNKIFSTNCFNEIF